MDNRNRCNHGVWFVEGEANHCPLCKKACRENNPKELDVSINAKRMGGSAYVRVRAIKAS